MKKKEHTNISYSSDPQPPWLAFNRAFHSDKFMGFVLRSDSIKEGTNVTYILGSSGGQIEQMLLEINLNIIHFGKKLINKLS